MTGTPDGEESRALTPRDPGAIGDPYERQYMKGEGAVLHRDRMVAGKVFNLFLLAVGSVSIGVPLLAGAPWVTTLLSASILAMVWLFFGVLRTTVSERSVNVQYGLIGPRIPVQAITALEVVDYDWTQYGGWGIRRGPEGWMYNMMGDGGRAVRIEWTDAKGRSKVTFVGTRGADRLGEAIERARATLPPGHGLDAIEDGRSRPPTS